MFGGAFDECRLGMDRLTKDIISLDSKICRQVLKLLFSHLLCAHLTLFLHLRVLIVLSNRFDDKTATIFHICRMLRYLNLLSDIRRKIRDKCRAVTVFRDSRNPTLGQRFAVPCSDRSLPGRVRRQPVRGSLYPGTATPERGTA